MSFPGLKDPSFEQNPLWAGFIELGRAQGTQVCMAPNNPSSRLAFVIVALLILLGLGV